MATHWSTDMYWHVYPLGALGVHPPRQERPAIDLSAWLDHVDDLGLTGVLLGPIFTSVAHGYDTLNHYEIDPRLGTGEDVDRFLGEARSRNIRVVLDGVFNHVSIHHRLVTEHPDWIKWVDGTPAPWEGIEDLVELNHTNPQVADFVVDVMCHWLERGVAGWRLDVAYAVPTDFWASVIDRVRSRFPDAFFLGEVIHGDYPAFVEASHVSTVTQYELWKAIWSSIVDSNPHELAHALGRHANFTRRFTPNTFIGNHDVTRIATRVGEKAGLAASILFTVPGMISVYYGDEWGQEGVKEERFGGDDEIRQALPHSAFEIPHGGQKMMDHYRSLIALRRENPWIADGDLEVTGADQGSLTYRVTGAGNTLQVRADYAAGTAEITFPGH